MNPTTLPPVLFGTASLGNLYVDTPFRIKQDVVEQIIIHNPTHIPFFDTAGKYGAGLALETLGSCLKNLNVPKDKVIISNKLGWYQTELKTPEPIFEKGIWKNLKHDAVQKISFNGILECFEQGNRLLGDYSSQMVSVHDPDQYLDAALDLNDQEKRYNDILEAYIALHELKQQGKIMSVGVGSKNWKVIERIAQDVDLDWVMLANCLTVKSHPKALVNFVKHLHHKGVSIINAAIFNGGFLVGEDFFNYQFVDINTESGKLLLDWRRQFFEVCQSYNILPAEACFNFVFKIPGIHSVALSTANPLKVKENIDLARKEIPMSFWDTMKAKGLLEQDFNGF